MIIIEPPLSSIQPHPPLSKRDLQQFLARAKKAVPLRGVVSVLLTSDEAVRDLNRRFRHKNEPTDVLSFPAADLESSDENLSTSRHQKIAGDLAISLETATRQAANYGHDLTLEIKVLILHGLLHLAGLDHESDSGEMAQREQELRKHLELPIGLIQRSKSPQTKRHWRRYARVASGEVNLRVDKTHVSKTRHGAPALVSDCSDTKRRSETP